MIQLRYLQVYTILILMFVSCDFSEDNIAEEAITEATVAELFEPVITQIAYNQSAISGYTSAALMQYFETKDASNAAWRSYNFVNVTMDQYWDSGLYTGSLRHANELQLLGEKDGNNDLQAIAQILKVNEFLNATTIFGDIPLLEALAGSQIVFPTFDPQESIYQELINMIESAIEMIGSNGISNTLSDADIVFQGDMSSWKKFAYGIKARLHLHLATKDAENYNQVLTSVENSFLSINEQAVYTWMQNNTVRNPLYSIEKERPGLFKISENFSNIILLKNDPRYLKIIFNNFEFQNDESPLYWTSTSTPLPLLSYAELNFMKAEALLETGAFDAEVIEALREGIKASFEQMDLAPEEYHEYLQTYASFNGLNTKSKKLEHIISEAYSSYYGYAFQQAWNNHKRLKIPNLVSTGNPIPINPTGDIPVRLLYPQIELDENTVNAFDAIDRQNGALLDEPLWIFKQ